MSNTLLKKVIYHSKAKEETTIDLNGNQVKYFDTFPRNPDSKTSKDTAERWAGKDNIEVEYSNEPFELKIISLEYRGEGGRAYKVIDNNNRLFDLREDQLIETISKQGIAKGGKLLGKFVWGMHNSQIKLVLVGGKLHQEMEKSLKLKNSVSQIPKNQLIKPSTLKFGHFYSRDDKIYLYLGKVNYNGIKLYSTVEITELYYYNEFPKFGSVSNDDLLLFLINNNYWIDVKNTSSLKPFHYLKGNATNSVVEQFFNMYYRHDDFNIIIRKKYFELKFPNIQKNGYLNRQEDIEYKKWMVDNFKHEK